MVFRFLLRFLNHPQIVEKLSESYPIRRAAQLTVFAFHKTKEIGYRSADKLQKSDQYQQLKTGTKEAVDHAQNIKDVFIRETKYGLGQVKEQLKEEMKKQQKR